MNSMVAVIPAYEPDASLEGLVGRLRASFRDIVVVNDGSRGAADVFARLGAADGVRVLSHPANRGKGAALKTAFAAVLQDIPEADGAVTVDADGQHLPEDVVRVAGALDSSDGRPVLGVRTFGADVPFRSRLGNLWTCGEFRILTGVCVRDTQTGLRAFPRSLLPRLLEIEGDGYEYEIRVLVDCVRRFGSPVQIPISTVYARGNATSHFRPLADTLKTQAALFGAAFGRLGR